MKKLTYEQVYENIIRRYKTEKVKLAPMSMQETILMQAIVDSFNENIEIFNNKNFICNKCGGSLSLDKTYNLTCLIYKCEDCNTKFNFHKNWEEEK